MKKVGFDKNIYYTDIPKDYEGWVNAKEYMPADYDLCSLKINGKNQCHGWAVGFKWDGLKVNREDEVLFWKKKREPT